MKAETLLFLTAHGLFFWLPKIVHGETVSSPDLHYLSTSDLDLEKLLPRPPGNYSSETATELEQILALQKEQTPEKIAAVQKENILTPFIFCGSVLPQINARSPRAIDFLLKVKEDAEQIAAEGTQSWDRPRPFRVDSKIEKLAEPTDDSSYPGINSTVVYTWATILINLLPEQKAAILAKADEIAQNRILAGIQYPSDVSAGKILGEAIAQKMMEKPAFQEELKKVRAEIAAPTGAVNTLSAKSTTTFVTSE